MALSPSRSRRSRPFPAAAILLAAMLAAGLALPPTTSAQGSEAGLIAEWQRRDDWRTDFSKHAVPLDEIMSGGPPRDGIPPIDDPKFVSVTDAAAWLADDEPVLVLRHEGDARAYPLQILIWHEIVNDTVGGRPVVVTFCPLCNSALVFDRRVDGAVLDFGTTGKLRHSDLVMWDRQTESWWQQLTGEAIVGTHTGKRLTLLPAPLVAFATFRDGFAKGKVLSRETGIRRSYGVNPYEHYDRGSGRPFLFRSEPDPRLPPLERVVALEQGGEARAYPYSRLAEARVVEDTLGGVSLVVLYQPGTRSALDRRKMAASRPVGAVGVFRRELEGRRLSFEPTESGFRDVETGSRWTLLGEAVHGPLKGRRLTPLVHGSPFAFAWFAFRPESTVWERG